MKKRITLILLILLFLSFAETISVAKTYSEEFSIKSKDKLTNVTGEIDFPTYENVKFPLILMVPGTGLFDRDVLFGESYTEQDKIFKDLSENLIEKGIATVRFDKRGIKCKCNNDKFTKNYYKEYVNKDITITQTPEALRDDIEEVYNYAKNNSRIDTDKILILAHSEGSVHVAYLVKNKKINPKAIHFMGMISESPASLIKWQMVDRINDIILSLDKNKDNKITNTELDKAQGFNATFAKAYKKEKNGYWKKSDLIKKLENDYLETKKDAISHKDSEVIFGYNSYKWWKMFFEDNNKVINNLLEYEGKIYVHNGDIDSQTPATREFKFIKEVENKFKIKPTLKLYKNKGHTLSNDRLFGPIDENSKRELIKYIKESVK